MDTRTNFTQPKKSNSLTPGAIVPGMEYGWRIHNRAGAFEFLGLDGEVGLVTALNLP